MGVTDLSADTNGPTSRAASSPTNRQPHLPNNPVVSSEDECEEVAAAEYREKVQVQRAVNGMYITRSAFLLVVSTLFQFIADTIASLASHIVSSHTTQ
jgi:hypothetical protein